MKRKLLSAMLAAVMMLSLSITALAYNPSVPGEAVTMAGDEHSFVVVDENNDLWVYYLSFVDRKMATGEHYGHGKPEKFDSNVASVSVSDSHIAYIKTDGSLWVYGVNAGVALGIGEKQSKQDKPIKVMENVIAVSAGDRCTAAVCADNTLWLWGSLPGLNPFGTDFDATHTPFKAADDVVAVSLVADVDQNPDISTDYGVFLKKDGTLWGWGSDIDHILTRSRDNVVRMDHPVKLMSNVASFATGARQCAAVTTAGDLYVWGYNYGGGLGFDWVPDTYWQEYQFTPRKVMSNVAKVAFTNNSLDITTYVLKKDGTLWGAGYSRSGQLGKNYEGIDHTPKYVKVMDGVTNIATIESGVYVTKEDGYLYALGTNVTKTVLDWLAVGMPGEKYVSTPTKTIFPGKVAAPGSVSIGSVEKPAGNPFTDIAYGTYCYDAILWAYENGVTTGTSATTFSPASVCTRGQVVTFLWRAMGCPEPKTKVNPFEDVKETDYFYKAVLWAYENGITTGTSDTRFTPGRDCAEAQIVTFLWRTLGEPRADLSVLTPGQQKSYYAAAQAWAYENGLVTSPAAIDTYYYCTRANVATYLYKTVGK